jgi:hypothetical protein
MAFSLGVVLAVRLLEAVAVNASRSYGASDGPRSERTITVYGASDGREASGRSQPDRAFPFPTHLSTMC